MSPYPAQVTRDAIVEQARAMIEADGLEGLTLQRLASALGVQAPSLYRHVASKTALLSAINEITLQRLVSAIRTAARTDDPPAERLLAMARAYRAFALASPVTYALAFTRTGHADAPAIEDLEALSLPVQHLIADVTGEANSLSALGGLWSLLHGFVSLELNGQFRRAPDLDSMFDEVVRAYVRGWRDDVL